MKQAQTARLEARANIIKAMAHATRLFIVEELAKGQRCVCERRCWGRLRGIRDA